MSGWPTVALGEVFEIARGGSPRPIDAYITDDPEGINWITITDASDGSKYITATRRRIKFDGLKRSRAVKAGDFLLTNSMSFGRPYIMGTSGCIHDGWLVLSPKRDDVDREFFYYLLGSKAIYSEFERRASGVTVKNLNIELVKGVTVGLPPISEQQRIAKILDKADALRARRRAALAQLDVLKQSIFLEMFGDPTSNPRGWSVTSLPEILALPLRNGLSPSHAGNVTARVLTLAAITGAAFNADAWKVARFQAPPPPDQSVRDDDFLICRGNGNPRLVGRGYFSPHQMADVTFPDTMIAARIDARRIEPRFLEHVWNSTAVRRQVESLARTTNGTYKVNQSMLEGITFLAPPQPLQHTFAQRTSEVDDLRRSQLRSLSELDALFASLQHRAFRGEL